MAKTMRHQRFHIKDVVIWKGSRAEVFGFWIHEGKWVYDLVVDGEHHRSVPQRGIHKVGAKSWWEFWK